MKADQHGANCREGDLRPQLHTDIVDVQTVFKGQRRS